MTAEETNRDKLATVMLQVGFAAGNGDLLRELEAQIIALQLKVERAYKIGYTRGIEARVTSGIA